MCKYNIPTYVHTIHTYITVGTYVCTDVHISIMDAFCMHAKVGAGYFDVKYTNQSLSP